MLPIGLVLGYEFDRSRWGTSTGVFANISPKKRIIFIRALFNVLGYMAKADGHVSELELLVALNIIKELKLNSDEQKMAMRAFNFGKEPNFKLSATLIEFKKNLEWHKGLFEQFIVLLVHGALASDLSATEKRLIVATAAHLDISLNKVYKLFDQAVEDESFQKYTREKSKFNYKSKRPADSKQNGYANKERKSSIHYPSKEIENAFNILGVSLKDSNDSIKRAYRLLLNQNHPDKIIGKGATREETELAHNRTIEIRQSYELIQKIRKFK